MLRSLHSAYTRARSLALAPLLRHDRQNQMDEQAGFRFAGIRVLSGRRAVLLDVDLPAALALPLRRLGDPGNAVPRHRGGGHRGPAAGQQRLGQRRHRARPLLALSAREERYVRRASHMSGEGARSRPYARTI